MISSDNLRAHAERLRTGGDQPPIIDGVIAALTQAAEYLDDLAAAVKDVHALLPAPASTVDTI
jgi:hypothetical protein